MLYSRGRKKTNESGPVVSLISKGRIDVGGKCSQVGTRRSQVKRLLRRASLSIKGPILVEEGLKGKCNSLQIMANQTD